MVVLSANQVSGDTIGLTRTHANHFASALPAKVTGGSATGAPAQGDGFTQMLLQALNGVNRLQQEADQASVRFITDPDSVEAHDVTIALAKANLAVSITKAVVDGALRAYTDIISIR